MGILLLIAILLAWPTFGLSLVAYVGVAIGRGFLQAKAREHHAEKLEAQREIKTGVSKLPSWMADRDECDVFVSGTQRLAERRGVPKMFSVVAMSNEELRGPLMRYAGAMEARGQSFIEQQMAVAEMLVELHNNTESAPSTDVEEQGFAKAAVFIKRPCGAIAPMTVREPKQLVNILLGASPSGREKILSLSQHLGGQIIKRFENCWDWSYLSSNEHLSWSIVLIKGFEARWDWTRLSQSSRLPWSLLLIEEFSGHWNWRQLSLNRSIPWSTELLERFEDQWDWFALGENAALPWSMALLDRFQERWTWGEAYEYQYSYFGQSLQWSIDIVNRFQFRWNWKFLSRSELIPWTVDLIARHEERWDWRSLSANPSLPFDGEMLERFQHRWLWKTLSENATPLWSVEMLERYADRWDWSALIGNTALPWSTALINRFADQFRSGGRWLDKWSFSQNRTMPWSVEFLERNRFCFDWKALSVNPSLPWSMELIEKYVDSWDWRSLSGNESLPWSVRLLERYEDRWHWPELSENVALPWSIALLERFEDRWVWDEEMIGDGRRPGLSHNRSLPWSPELLERFHGRWNATYILEEAFAFELPAINRADVIEIMQRHFQSEANSSEDQKEEAKSEAAGLTVI